jgi:hypothetical protein
MYWREREDDEGKEREWLRPSGLAELLVMASVTSRGRQDGDGGVDVGGEILDGESTWISDGASRCCLRPSIDRLGFL